MKIKKISYLYLFVWIAGLTYASVTPPGNIPNLFNFENLDKIVHFIMYFGLTILLIPVLFKKNQFRKVYFFSLMIASLTGILMEYFQFTLTELRHGSVLDALANFVGSLSGIAFFHLVIRKTRLVFFFFKT
ncbi:MAG: VanZ family protein [Bacteroidales bacterium]|nr:VanZ family protein [Bacteroidales bacterium]